MTYWATLRNGGQMLLGEPKEAVLSYDRGAPADQLKAVFPADRIWEELAEVLLYDQCGRCWPGSAGSALALCPMWTSEGRSAVRAGRRESSAWTG